MIMHIIKQRLVQQSVGRITFVFNPKLWMAVEAEKKAFTRDADALDVAADLREEADGTEESERAKQLRQTARLWRLLGV